jgi:maleate isomerase
MNLAAPISAIHVHPVQPELDQRPMEKRVGLIVLATDHSTEPDFSRTVAGPSIGVYVARIAYARKMQPRLAEGAALVLPGEPLDVVCFSCSSASVVIGDEAVEAAIHQAKPDTPVVTPPLAAVRGLRALGAKRISILTPYTPETSRPMAAYFEAKGFTITRFTCLGFDDDREMARISPKALVDIAREAAAQPSDALFISCTALRAALVAPAIEAATGCPAVTSNQASAWNVLRLCGNAEILPHFGQLMTLPLGADEAP